MSAWGTNKRKMKEMKEEGVLEVVVRGRVGSERWLCIIEYTE